MTEQYTLHLADTLIVMTNAVEHGHSDLLSAICPTIWPIFCIILILFGLLLLFNNKCAKKFVTNHLSWIALFIWLSGFLLYAIGFKETGSTSPITLSLRAALSSLEMFVSHSDLLEVADKWHHNSAYMLWFAITHFLAVVASAIFIVRLLGLRIMSWLTSFIYSLRKRDIFVFWGVNKNSVITAKSIREKNEKACILYINLPNEQHEHSSRFTFSHFFHTPNESIERYVTDIEDIEALLLNANKPINQEAIKNKDNIFNSIGLPRHCDKLIKNVLDSECNKVEYFFLSDNEDENISAIVALKSAYKDIDNVERFRCYCHARKNSFNTAMLDCNGLRNNIYLVDSSSLSILPLKENVDNHPISFVDKNTEEGYVTSDFMAMVIGFGETGRDAFRFLYEFASLPCDKNGTANSKTILVVDEKLDSLMGDFLNDAPALKEKSSEIQWWHNISTHSEIFWTKIKGLINSLNYIVITVGNDEEALDLAVDLFEFAYRYRENTDKFKIYVRLRSNEMHHCLSDMEASCIVPFGQNDKVFKYETLSVDAVEKGAMKFYHEYKKHEVENDEMENDKEVKEIKKAKLAEYENNSLGLWQWRKGNIDPKTGKLQYRKRETKEDFIELYYQEEQDKSNFWHIKTKRSLAGLPKDDLEKLAAFSLIKGSTLLKNLRRCEHLRWNAKMEILGFVHKDAPKDYKKRTHPCIIKCEDLEQGAYAYTLPYDEAVVKLSFDRSDKEK